MSKAQAWSAYWSQMGESGGCLPGAPPVVDAHLTQLWGNFAAGFPAGAKLLDLACGTGAVLRSVLRANRELSLVGVDYADLPKGKSKKIKLIGGTDIADMRFKDGEFDGLTSQFGVEYSDIDAAAAEIARVTKPGARLQFIVHHAESPIVEQNRNRHSALAAIERSSTMQMGRAAAAQPGSDTGMLSQTLSLIARSHPGQTVVNEIAAAIDHTVRFGGKNAAREFDRIENNLAQELAVLGALQSVALDEAGATAFVDSLGTGFACSSPQPVQIQGLATPLAWLVSGKRSG
ncbi:methyltransferase domain-containing protein [Parasphingopyxis sp. CP4]|uniref:class I SAM-dependent methyltransferase n=1 Tax=Parasphingopyxis sp. CP4 TaxID=2724527 RepID=UPI0015A10847|nr:methyltransferase domain-containing protein [Parasphingopyxis sp. CP4]QLC22558.1 methyltransferase domain-containing protein [Parasphingopyxis sp. CP4]